MLRTPRGAVLGTAVTHRGPGRRDAPGTRPGRARRPTDTRPGPAYKNSQLSTEQRVADLLSRMTLAEKIGQMTQAERIDVDADPSLITTYGLGSILSGGGSTPASNTPEAWADMVDRYQEAALETRLGIPILYGVDTVHGHGNLQGATVFPHNIGLGATRDPELVEDDRPHHRDRDPGERTAVGVRAVRLRGARRPLGPHLRELRRGPEAGHEDGDRDRRAPGQRRRRPGPAGPGAGDRQALRRRRADHLRHARPATTPSTRASTRSPAPSSTRLALAPYVPAMQEAPRRLGHAVLLQRRLDRGRARQPDQDAREPGAHHRLAQGQHGFDGLVISDWRAIRQIPGDYREQVRPSVNAGVDMFMEPIQAPNNPDGWDVFIPTLTALVEDGDVPMSRIDDAVSRILTAKFELGLFEHPFTDRRNIDTIGSKAHRKVARRAVAESQVLLKNKQGTLPLSPGKKQPVYVAGSNADNIGNQAGGWTLTWQGGSTNVIPGQTVLDAVRATSRSRVQFSETAGDPVPANAAGVVVVGETPYAEGFGDVNGPQWAYDPGDHNVPRPKKTMELSDADAAGDPPGLLAGRVVHGARRLRPADDHPAGAAHPDRRARGVVAAGQRGDGHGRRAVRQEAVHRQAAR